jgi:hypothetical protein
MDSIEAADAGANAAAGAVKINPRAFLDAVHGWAGAGAALLAGLRAHPRLSGAQLARAPPWSDEMALASSLMQLARGAGDAALRRLCASWALDGAATALLRALASVSSGDRDRNMAPFYALLRALLSWHQEGDSSSPYPFSILPTVSLELAAIIAEDADGHDRQTVTTVLSELLCVVGNDPDAAYFFVAQLARGSLPRWHAGGRRALCDRMVRLLAIRFWMRDHGGRALASRADLVAAARRMADVAHDKCDGMGMPPLLNELSAALDAAASFLTASERDIAAAFAAADAASADASAARQHADIVAADTLTALHQHTVGTRRREEDPLDRRDSARNRVVSVVSELGFAAVRGAAGVTAPLRCTEAWMLRADRGDGGGAEAAAVMTAAAKAAGVPVHGDNIFVGCAAQSIAVLGWQPAATSAAALPRALPHRALLNDPQLGLKTVGDAGRVLPQQAGLTSDAVESGAVVSTMETAVLARVLREAPGRLTAGGAALARRFTSVTTGALSGTVLARVLLRFVAFGQRNYRASLSETRTGEALRPDEQALLAAALAALAAGGSSGWEGEDAWEGGTPAASASADAPKLAKVTGQVVSEVLAGIALLLGTPRERGAELLRAAAAAAPGGGADSAEGHLLSADVQLELLLLLRRSRITGADWERQEEEVGRAALRVLTLLLGPSFVAALPAPLRTAPTATGFARLFRPRNTVLGGRLIIRATTSDGESGLELLSSRQCQDVVTGDVCTADEHLARLRALAGPLKVCCVLLPESSRFVRARGVALCCCSASSTPALTQA